METWKRAKENAEGKQKFISASRRLNTLDAKKEKCMCVYFKKHRFKLIEIINLKRTESYPKI